MCYFDCTGKRIRESTFTEDWQEANKKLRERLGKRDNRVLEIVRKGEQMEFENGWIFSWRIIPSRPYALTRLTKPICEPANI